MHLLHGRRNAVVGVLGGGILRVVGSYKTDASPFDLGYLYDGASAPGNELLTLVYPGASPSEVTREIIEPVEDAIFGISGVDGEKSTCSGIDGLATCTIFFDFEKPIQQASQDIRDAISTRRDDLPPEMEEPVLTRFDPSEEPIITMNFYTGSIKKNLP